MNKENQNAKGPHRWNAGTHQESPEQVLSENKEHCHSSQEIQIRRELDLQNGETPLTETSLPTEVRCYNGQPGTIPFQSIKAHAECNLAVSF